MKYFLLSVVVCLCFLSGSLKGQDVILSASHEVGNPGDTICFGVNANRFQDVLAMQMSIEWDTTHLDFFGLGNLGLEGLNGNKHFGLPGQSPTLPNGRLTVAWDSGDLQPKSVEAGESLFELCFIVKPEGGVCSSSISFVDSPTNIKFLLENEQEATFALNPGGISKPIIKAISPNISICKGSSTQLFAEVSDGASFSWSPSNGLDNPESNAPIASPNQTTVYSLVAKDEFGCETIQNVTVLVVPEYCDGVIKDTLALGQRKQWCLDLSVAGGVPGFEFSDNLTCTPQNGAIEFDIDYNQLCVEYTGVQIDTDELCISLCSQNGGSCLDYQLILTVVEDLVWPGDTDLDGYVTHFDILPLGLALDSIGPQRESANLDWIGQSASNWEQQTPGGGVNFKHIDTDGNGLIGLNDTLGIINNWGKENYISGLPPVLETPTNIDGVPFYIKPDLLSEGLVYRLPIVLGEGDLLAEDVYGLGFSISYDPLFILPGSVYIDFKDSWLGNINEDMIAIQKNFSSAGRIDVGLTRIDGSEVTGEGVVGHLNFIVVEDIIFIAKPLDRETSFQIHSARIINRMETELLVSTSSTDVKIISSTEEATLNRAVQVYPNPTRNTINIDVLGQGVKLEEVSLTDIRGRELQRWSPRTNALSLDHQKIPSGTYVLRIATDQGLIVKRIMVIR